MLMLARSKSGRHNDKVLAYSLVNGVSKERMPAAAFARLAYQKVTGPRNQYSLLCWLSYDVQFAPDESCLEISLSLSMEE